MCKALWNSYFQKLSLLKFWMQNFFVILFGVVETSLTRGHVMVSNFSSTLWARVCSHDMLYKKNIEPLLFPLLSILDFCINFYVMWSLCMKALPKLSLCSTPHLVPLFQLCPCPLPYTKHKFQSNIVWGCIWFRTHSLCKYKCITWGIYLEKGVNSF